MCVVCGCASGGQNHHDHVEQTTSSTSAVHTSSVAGSAAATDHHQFDDLHYGAGAARVSVPGMSQERAIKIEADILGENNRIAAQNRHHFADHGVTALNFVSSPGSGKTTLLCATIVALKERHAALSVSVIEGDQQTTFDADRIRATGAPAIQINTGKGCHLDAPMVAEAFTRLHSHAHHEHDDDAPSLLFIENVGNLVCPAAWDLGEAAKVAILSVTEGEDKPLKYPDMFAAAKLMLLNKIDLLPHLQFDVARCIEAAKRVNPHIEVIQLSATTGEGMKDWLHWLEHAMGHVHGHDHVHPQRHANDSYTEISLRQRIAALEAELANVRQTVQP